MHFDQQKVLSEQEQFLLQQIALMRPTGRSAVTPWLVLTLIALATLAFGAVYPWAYLPLFVAAATIGAIGIATAWRRAHAPSGRRRSGASGDHSCHIQLIPLPADVC